MVVPELAGEIAQRIAADEAEGLLPEHEVFLPGPAHPPLRLFRVLEPAPVPASPGPLREDARPHRGPDRATTRPTSTSSSKAAPSGWTTSWTITPIRRSRPGSRSTTATPSGKRPCTSGSCTSRSPRSIGRGKRFKRWLKKVYLRLPMRPLVRFVYAYVLRLGFLDGKPGLVFCTLLAFYDFLAWANVYEQRLGALQEQTSA